MITLTSLQRDFLDRYYSEMVDAEVGYATHLARQHGFTPGHFNRLLESYRRSWGGDLRVWGRPYPPLSPPPAPPIFPWSSIQDLEDRLREEEAGLEFVNS